MSPFLISKTRQQMQLKFDPQGNIIRNIHRVRPDKPFCPSTNENMPMQYTEIFKVVKMKIFGRKILIYFFFLFLLKA